MKDKFLA